MSKMNSKAWTWIDRTEAGLWGPLYEDPCFYYLVHTDEGYDVPSNQRIINFKHDPERFRDNEQVWGYKLREIESFAHGIAGWLGSISIAGWKNVALIPMPTSKPSNHEFFDPRLVELCERVAELDHRVRVENVLDISETVQPSHTGGPRDIEFLKSRIVVREPSHPLQVGILVDDIVTSGSHYVACREKLKGAFPNIGTIGLFLARHRERPQ